MYSRSVTFGSRVMDFIIYWLFLLIVGRCVEVGAGIGSLFVEGLDGVGVYAVI